MANLRRTYSQAEEISLTTQVGGYCPLCPKPLFYFKRTRQYKDYELAHIYPLNPRPEELLALHGVELLHSDVNHPDNIIPLCTSCHGRFDKPRTREEYEELAEIKRRLVDQAAQRALNVQYPLDADIGRIITRLHNVAFDEANAPELELDAKSMQQKFDGTMPGPIQRKIRHAVVDYYRHILHEFKELELQTPVASQVIYSQVRSYYLTQKRLGLAQPAVFANVVEWIRASTDTESLEAAEIVASFFVQNCEIFE